jgi:hypothetical protein
VVRWRTPRTPPETRSWAPHPRTSGKAVLGLVSGLLSFACGFLALTSGLDPFLLGVVLFGGSALVLGFRGWAEIKRAPDRLRGKGVAGWGLGVATAGFVLGFLLLPAT